MIFKGSAVAIITPFDENLEVDYKSYDRLLKFHLDNKTDAVVVCGTTGEAATMTEDERYDLISYTVEKIGSQIPVIAGTGSNNTKASADFSKRVGKIDNLAGILVVTPYYNKATREGVYKHFEYIAKESKAPMILYNVPSRTNVSIDVETVKRLSKIDNIVGIKDATGDLSYTAELRRVLGDGFGIYSGNDDLTFPMLSLGIDGSISVFANIAPKLNHDIYELFTKGSIKESKDFHLKSLKLINTLFNEVNPIPVKYAASKLGLCENHLRLPLTNASKETVKLIDKNLKELNLC